MTPRYRSHVTVFDIASHTTEVIHTDEGVTEAPNWSRDGSFSC